MSFDVFFCFCFCFALIGKRAVYRRMQNGGTPRRPAFVTPAVRLSTMARYNDAVKSPLIVSWIKFSNLLATLRVDVLRGVTPTVTHANKHTRALIA